MILTSLGRASFQSLRASRLAAQTTYSRPAVDRLACLALPLTLQRSRCRADRHVFWLPPCPPAADGTSKIVGRHDDLIVSKRRLVGRCSPGYGRVALVTSELGLSNSRRRMHTNPFRHGESSGCPTFTSLLTSNTCCAYGTCRSFVQGSVDHDSLPFILASLVNSGPQAANAGIASPF